RGEGDRGRYHVEGDGRRGRRAVPVGGGDAERVGADREARDDDRAPRPEGAVAARAPADGGGEVAVLGVGRGGGEEHGLPGEEGGAVRRGRDGDGGRRVRRPDDDGAQRLAGEAAPVGRRRGDDVRPGAEARGREARPEPMSPSRSDVQRSDAERLPSVASFAVPLKATPVPAKTVVPSGGPVIATTGGVAVTVRRTCAEPVAPSESVTDAVRTWLPSESVTVRVPPPPSAPSRLDAHWILLVTLPSKSSVAVAPS